MCSVVDVRDENFDVYIGRRMPGYPASIWANPFEIGRDGSRAEVIRKFRQYLLNNPALLALLPTLKNKVLGCWCRGLACHGDVIAEMVNNLPV